MKPNQFDGAQILAQLKCAGMSSALRVMQRGFPSRLTLDTFQYPRPLNAVLTIRKISYLISHLE